MKAQTRHHAISLPILIASAPDGWMKKGDEEGRALMLSPCLGDAVLLRFPSSRPVRRFKDADFKYAQEMMGDVGTLRFVALILLQTAMISKQKEDIKKAREKLCAAVASECQHRESVGAFLRTGLGEQRKKRIDKGEEGSMMDEIDRMLHPGDLADEAKMLTTRYLTQDAMRLFGTEMTNALNGVQLVIWQSGNSVKPALYCNSHVSAAYATALFGRRWRVCPYSGCGKWFIPTRAKQDHCCAKHRDAHRVARWRMRQKTRSKQRQT